MYVAYHPDGHCVGSVTKVLRPVITLVIVWGHGGPGGANRSSSRRGASCPTGCKEKLYFRGCRHPQNRRNEGHVSKCVTNYKHGQSTRVTDVATWTSIGVSGAEPGRPEDPNSASQANALVADDQCEGGDEARSLRVGSYH